MKIKALTLDNFRNYKKETFEIDPSLTVITGPNGIGKTNILEAVYLLSAGKSPRAVVESDMVKEDSDYARVVGVYDSNDKLEVGIQRKENSNRIQKKFKINGAVKLTATFVGNSKAILFAPEDIRLVAGSPSRRREHLDRILGQVHREYVRNLSKYNRILKQRNKFLETIKGQIFRNIHEAQLAIWSEQLVAAGEIIQNYRREFFVYAKTHLPEISRNLYQEGLELGLHYNESHLSKERLASVKSREVMYGTTQIGPHRDDYSFILSSTDLKNYGSRGQQRTGVLCLKVLEMDYMRDKSQSSPILLLDDIFSELDKNYRKAVESISKNQQTLITTADIDMVPNAIRNTSKLISL